MRRSFKTELTKETKKMLKGWAKRMQAKKELRQDKIEGLLIHKADGDYDQEKHVFLVKASSEGEALKNVGEYYPVGGLSFTSAYDCTGRPFCNPANIKEVAPERFMIHLSISYDV